MNITQCGYFKHPSDERFGASPDAVSTGEHQFLVEIKTRALPNSTHLDIKLKKEEKDKKMEISVNPLQQVRFVIIVLYYVVSFHKIP